MLLVLLGCKTIFCIVKKKKKKKKIDWLKKNTPAFEKKKKQK